jgi:hypothetical protein
MRIILRALLITAVLLANVSASSAQVSIGIRIGPPPPPRVVYVMPHKPGHDYVWIEGYWYPLGHSYKWHKGYWSRPPYPGAVWIVPRYNGAMYFAGYWSKPPGRNKHDNARDRERNRDGRRYHDGDHDR